MHQHYIQARQIFQVITHHQDKALNLKPAKRSEVPADYRKERFAKLRPYLEEILLYAVGFTELIRKGMKL